MKRLIRWGILGTGAIAAKFTADMAHAPSSRLVAIASRDVRRAEDFIRHMPNVRIHHSYEALVDDDEIDAVYIATPNALHKDHSLLAIQAGKAVLCEKPFALSAAEAKEVVDAARQANVFCMEAMWTRFLPAVTGVKRLVDAGAIGIPRYFNASAGFLAPNDSKNRFNSRELGGGALLDLGVYGVSMAYFFLGAPVRVSAQARFGATGVDRQIVATLHYHDCVATIAASHDAELSNTLDIVGATGRIAIAPPFLQATRASITAFSAPPDGAPQRESSAKAMLKRTGLWPLTRAIALAVLGRNDRQIKGAFLGDGYQFEIEEVARALTSGVKESEVMPLDETIAVMETLDQIQAAAS